MQKTMIIGTLGKDAEVKEVNGKQVANFSVAVNNGKDKPATWYECALWEKPNVYPYIKKGDKIYLEGNVSSNAYLKDGDAVGKLRLTVFSIELLGSNKQDGTTAPVQQQQPQQSAGFDAHNVAALDDLPF